MSQHSHARVPRRAAPSTRISSYLLTEYLERLGVEVIFGLCGHTVIGFLDALARAASASSARGTSRWRRMPPTATPAPRASRASCCRTSARA